MSEPGAAVVDRARPWRRPWGNGWVLVFAWMLTRALMLRSFSDFRWIDGDVKYYFASIAWPEGTIQTILREYPVPVVWLFKTLQPVSASDEAFVVAFAIAMGVLDAAFVAFCWFAPRFAPTAHGDGSRAAAWFWTLFTALLGPILWFRFDIIPAVVVGVAMVLVMSRPRLAGALIAFGASLKLWPALLLLPNLGRDRASRRRLVGFTVTGVVLAGSSLVAAGWTRLVSPITWQGGRGLQIESLSATWLMFLHGFGTSPRWTIFFSPYNAFELEGPGVESWAAVSNAAMLTAGLVALALGVLALIRHPGPAVRTLAVVTITCGMLAANKTLSPQYMLWLAGPVAALLVHLPDDARGRVRVGYVALSSLLMAGMTQYVFPIAYMSLIANPYSGPAVTAVLVARNLLLGVLSIQLSVWSLTLMWGHVRGTPAQRQGQLRTPGSVEVPSHD